MASFDVTRSKTNDGFEMQCSGKTEKDSVQEGSYEVIADTKNDSQKQNTQLAGTEAVYESLTKACIPFQEIFEKPSSFGGFCNSCGQSGFDYDSAQLVIRYVSCGFSSGKFLFVCR